MSQDAQEVVIIDSDGHYWAAIGSSLRGWTYASRSRAKRALRSAGLDQRDFTIWDYDKYRLLHGDTRPPAARTRVTKVTTKQRRAEWQRRRLEALRQQQQ